MHYALKKTFDNICSENTHILMFYILYELYDA